MKSFSYLIALLLFQVFTAVASAVAQTPGGQYPLALSDAVLPTSSNDPLLDPRIFNPEFYWKFNPELGLTTDQKAIQQWTSTDADHCLRGSFNFYAPDYLKRYPDLGLPPASPSACDSAVRQFVRYGFNQGRIGAFESYPIVFDFNYYVDAANNPDINQLYSSGTWDQVDVQIHWLQHGIDELRGASAFFNIKEYQERYADVAGLRPERALFEYVTVGQAERRLGRILWADPSEWSALVATTQESPVIAAPNDLVRSFTAANGKLTTAIVKSPTGIHRLPRHIQARSTCAMCHRPTQTMTGTISPLS